METVSEESFSSAKLRLLRLTIIQVGAGPERKG